jgi:hypothetical protein
MDNDRQDANTPGDAVRNRHHAGCRVAAERAADRYTIICDGPANPKTAWPSARTDAMLLCYEGPEVDAVEEPTAADIRPQ